MVDLAEIPIGYEWLVEASLRCGAAEQDDVISIASEAAGTGASGIALVLEKGLVKEDDFSQEVARVANLPWRSEILLAEDQESLTSFLPATLAVRYQVFPLAVDDDSMDVVCYDPFDPVARQLITRRANKTLRWSVASRRKVREAISNLYGVGAGTFEDILESREKDSGDGADTAMVIDDDLSDEASVLKFVNQIIREALNQKATDIHVEPQRNKMLIRYRVDGQLFEVPIPEHIHQLQSAVIARLKIMAGIDVSEKRVPQDGRINLSHEGKSIDVRVATIPCIEGETVSLRLLNQDKFSLAKLELEDGVRNSIEALLQISNGVILATGPTGSGKSTSLYSFLGELNTPDKRIVTIEDPVENKLPRAAQIAVRAEIGLTFAKGLRSILRADPNVVMVGEIRDVETAEIAIRASLTGHLVFSTLHTNSAIGAVSRLVDMGIEPFLVSASVRGLLAQRLVRRLCVHCKRPVPAWNSEMRDNLGIPEFFDEVPYEAVGCPECRQSGYSGRVALYELCVISPEIQEIISQGGDENEIKAQALREGFEDMRIYGLRKVMKGVTTVEEVFSSTQSHLVI